MRAALRVQALFLFFGFSIYFTLTDKIISLTLYYNFYQKAPVNRKKPIAYLAGGVKGIPGRTITVRNVSLRSYSSKASSTANDLSKELDLTRDPEWTLELTEQLKGTRAISTGGILKPYFRELENESEDLIGKGDEEEETLGHVFAMWQRDCQRYVVKD